SPFEAVGFRYLSVVGTTPTAARVRERRYPMVVAGSFDSDDPSLDAIWQVGLRTLHLCATDAYLDCPGREQRAWLGDAYVHGLLTYVTSSDTTLATHALRLAAQAPRP